jgi:hypothetical protein
VSKKQYAAPEIRLRGDIREITRANVFGGSLDASFPGGTPGSALTFS